MPGQTVLILRRIIGLTVTDMTHDNIYYRFPNFIGYKMQQYDNNS